MLFKRVRHNQTFKSASKRFTKLSNSFKPFWQRHQLKIVGLLTIGLILSLVATSFTKPEPEPEVEETVVRETEVYRVNGQQPSQTLVGTIKNLSSITLVAQSAGPIVEIKHREGSYVSKGSLIAKQSSTYSGGNAQAVSLQIARKNLELAEASLNNTVEVVSKNRELADRNRDNIEELRKISDQSIGETENLLDLINKQIESTRTALETATGATADALRGTLISLEANRNQTESALRNVRYQVETDNPPTALANINKDLVYATTEIQLKSAQINQDIAKLSLQQAYIAYSSTKVVAPFAGTIEKIYVEPGQYVSPGTPVAKITGEPKLCLVVNVSGALASQIDANSLVTVTINENQYQYPIAHVTSTPTSGNLYEILVSLPDWLASQIYENQSVEIKVQTQTSSITSEMVIPLDSLFVTNTSRFVLVVEDEIAKRRIVETGQLVGSSIAIKSGLLADDQIILDRSVNENDLVQPIN